MQVNITLPLKWAQCWGYVLILMSVNIMLIFPLSAFLFSDFYSRLIPADSVQTVPFAAGQQLGTGWSGGKAIYAFKLKRYSTETAEIPQVIPNGFPQGVPIRADIPYNVNLDLNVFCLNKVTDLSIRDGEITLSVSRHGKPAENVLFRKTLLMTCANTRDIPTLGASGKLSPTFARKVQQELVNHIHLEKPIILQHDVEKLELSLKFAGNANLIVDTSTSFITLSLNFEHSLRNLMVRWKKLTHVVGTLLFNAIISFFFLAAFAISFFRAGHVRGSKMD
ncbi:LADA_0H13322g1_1 [Lachancea dasiensis]|uniref:LADA_0H13322g1_1 n=1 Tax=Lachancea dasiensis TaxID=1072105 RepID=A0A1G4K460_9SACH|nr:LADA_0H13322g1_1 [Lachancea dasiensis]